MVEYITPSLELELEVEVTDMMIEAASTAQEPRSTAENDSRHAGLEPESAEPIVIQVEEEDE